MGPKLANVYSVESWISLRPAHLGSAPVQLPGMGRNRDLLRCPPPTPQSPSLIGLGRFGQAISANRPYPPLGLGAAPRSYSGGRDGAPLGKARKVSESQAPVVCFRTLHPSTTTTNQLSLQECLAGPKVHPNCLESSKLSPSPGRRAPTHRIALGGAPSVLCPRRGIVAGRTGTARPARSALLAAG